MEEIKAPKKERKFLKAVGNIAKVLANELVMGIGRKFIGKAIDKVGNKRQGLIIAFLLVAGISYASIDSIPYPVTGNKQRLGWQTSGNGLVYRGRSNDTITKPSSYVDKNVKAYLLLDSVRGTIFVWRQTYWDSILVGGGGTFAQPIDSLFFNTSVLTNNVETAKMRWDSDLATVVLGLNDNVPNELGFKSFWLVKNQTGTTITKGSIVYANGTVGASGRITVAKFIANGSIDAKYLLGITAHDLTDGEDGYVISFGKIRQVNTDTFVDGAILYPSPTVAGVWTDVEPIAPNIDLPIGFCINSSSNNGTIAIRVASGYKLSELHDVAISSPLENSSLYYKGGLWRDTTAALLVSDTAAMLANYATKEYADTTGRLYARQDFTNVETSTLTWTQSDTLIPGGVTVVQVYRNGQILLPSQYTIPTSTSVVIASTSFKVGDNYTVIFPRGGGAGSGGGSGSLTSISAGTGITVSPNPITTTGVVSADLSVLMELTDTTLLNLTSRFASKLNTTDTASLSSRIDAKGTGTVTSVATGYGLTGGTITNTGTLVLDSATVFLQIRDSIVDVAIGNDTIKILKQEYAPATTSVLTWTITPKFPIQLKQYILVFRNGQLLINDQYNLTDTNKITIVSNSFKVGSNYTVVTVSGIGSVGTGTFPNPVYPDAGIALSTGTTWASSIPNNSTNWNTAYTDRLKWDGGITGLTPSTGRTSLGGTTIGQSMFTLTNPSAISFPRFNTDNTVTALSAATFRSAIGAGTVTNVIAATTAGNPISITNNTTTPIIELLSATSGRNGYLTSTDWTTFNNKQTALNGTGFVKASGTSITYDNSTYLTTALASTTYLTKTDTAAMLLPYLRDADTTNMLLPYFKDTDTTLLNLTSRFAAKQNNITLTTTGTSGASTFDGTTLNIPNYTSSGGGTGTVTSVGLTAPSIFTVSGSPVTTSGTLALNYSGTALPLLNGGTGATTSDAALTNFGATAMGKSLFGLTNTVSDKFIKVNTNNTITLLNAADTRTAIGAGTGTVTSVSSGSSSISVATGTTTPVITIADAGLGNSGVMTAGDQQFQGEKRFFGIVQFIDYARFNSTAYTATRIAGLSSTNRLSDVTLGTGLSLSGGVLSATSGGAEPNLYFALNGPTIVLSSSMGSQSTYFLHIDNVSTVTVTLPTPSLNTNKSITIKNGGSGAVNSNTTNVQRLTGPTSNVILLSGGGKWATLVSDGFNWITMAAN